MCIGSCLSNFLLQLLFQLHFAMTSQHQKLTGVLRPALTSQHPSVSTGKGWGCSFLGSVPAECIGPIRSLSSRTGILHRSPWFWPSASNFQICPLWPRQPDPRNSLSPQQAHGHPQSLAWHTQAGWNQKYPEGLTVPWQFWAIISLSWCSC